MNTETWINVFNAIGTSAAAAIALYLGLRANRRQGDDELARARLFASRISARLASTAERLRLHCALAGFRDETISEEGAIAGELGQIAEFLRGTMYFPDDATLTALTPLPNNCAHRIARAADYVERVREQVPRLTLDMWAVGGDTENQRKLLASWTGDLDAAASLLQVAIAELIAAAELGAPMPSGEEIYGGARRG